VATVFQEKRQNETKENKTSPFATHRTALKQPPLVNLPNARHLKALVLENPENKNDPKAAVD